MSLEDLPNITDWYNDQSIFITGVTGFLGKVLLYKLLKSCSGIRIIYVLLRPRKGKTPQERLDDLFSTSIFDEFKLKSPELLKKVQMIEGDVSKPYLGMIDSDWEMLQENVTIVFNAAASIRFDDTLQKALFTNTRSAKYAILLAKGMRNLKAFVHVSTAYTNCNFPHIKEEVIPVDFDPEKLITAAEQMDEYALEIFSEKIKGNFPNTYIFTKNIAEVLVHKERNNLPLVIYRPALIAPSNKEPEPGWVEGFNGASALMVAVGKGVLRIFISAEDHCFDYIVVDACVNGMIVSAWYRSVYLPTKRIPLEKNIIFNATDYKQHQGELAEFYTNYMYEYPVKQLWTTYYYRTPHVLLYKILNIILHVIPGLAVDGLLKLKGKKPRLMKLYRKLYSACLTVQYFTLNNWVFDTDNFDKLKYIVPQDERKIFFIDSSFETTKQKLIMNAYRGGRKLGGDTLEFSKKDVERVLRLYWIDRILRVAVVGIFLWMLPLKKTWDWSVDLVEEYQEAWNKLDEDYLLWKESRSMVFH